MNLRGLLETDARQLQPTEKYASKKNSPKKSELLLRFINLFKRLFPKSTQEGHK